MANSNNYYIKALNKFHDGEIDSAIELCEKSIALNIKNKAAINLKGLLQYLKGDLQSAQNLWQLNYRTNKDEVAKKYLQDSKNDSESLVIYKKALPLLEQLNITEALDMLLQCRKSDYNMVNVCNYIAFCYMKKGEYEKACGYVDKVLAVHRRNEMALHHKKLLREYGVVKEREFGKVPVIIIILCCLLLGGAAVWEFGITGSKVATGKGTIAKGTTKSVKNAELKVANVEQRPKTETQPNEDPPKVSQEVQQQSTSAFPHDKLLQYTSRKDIDRLYSIVTDWNGKDVKTNDKVLLSRGEDILRGEGVEFFYKRALGALGNKNYEAAEQDLLKAYQLGDGNYLYPHAIYMLGVCNENKQDIEQALKFYNEYDQKYSKENYEDTVLYKLATLNKDIDAAAAKQFAQKLAAAYPSSMYNNTIIKEIVAQ